MKRIFSVMLLSAVMVPGIAQAYVGPGAGVSAIGAALALIAAIFFAIVGFVWYPIKRLRRKLKKPAEAETAGQKD